jgi:hypothetical protein
LYEEPDSRLLKNKFRIFRPNKFFSSFLKKSELISAVWLGGWVAGWLGGWGTSFEELGRDRDFQFFAIDSVGRRGDSIIKIMDPAPRQKFIGMILTI